MSANRAEKRLIYSYMSRDLRTLSNDVFLTPNPTDPFTIFVAQYPPIDDSEQHRVCRSASFLGSKIVEVSVGNGSWSLILTKSSYDVFLS